MSFAILLRMLEFFCLQICHRDFHTLLAQDLTPDFYLIFIRLLFVNSLGGHNLNLLDALSASKWFRIVNISMES